MSSSPSSRRARRSDSPGSPVGLAPSGPSTGERSPGAPPRATSALAFLPGPAPVLLRSLARAPGHEAH
eukprot:1438809-Pyramimonas_sp.AAC.1